MWCFSLSVGLLRFLGGFPYCEVKTEIAEVAWGAERPQKNANFRLARRSYEKSLVWVLWSCCVVALLLGITGEAIYRIFAGADGVFVFTITLQVARSFTHTINFAALVLIVGCLLWKTSLALAVISELQNLRSLRLKTSTNLCRNLSMAFILFVFLVGNLSLLGTLGTKVIITPSLFISSYIFKLEWTFLIQLFVISFYYAAISLISDVYDSILSTLPQLQNKEVKIGTNGQPVRRDRNRTSISASVSEEDLLRNTSETLIRLHDLLRLLHRYMGYPIALIVLQSVVSTILAWFYFAFWTVAEIEVKLLTVGHMIGGAVPPFVLCNIPELLQSRVDELMLVMCSLKRSTTDQRHKEQIAETREIMDEFPGFMLCGIFTLGRARLVDIYSFMATYFIILLQFQVSEKDL